MRQLSNIDRAMSHFDSALRTAFGAGKRKTSFQHCHKEAGLTDVARARSGELMRINHCGEICAQALYHGQALTAKDGQTKQHLLAAADEEADHLGWCEARLDELNERTSHLNAFWYASSFFIGALTGLMGNRVNLGFVAATEEEVCKHIDRHLSEVAEEDLRTREILLAMREDELKHQADAIDLGGAVFPGWLKRLMTLSSKAMTTSTRYI